MDEVSSQWKKLLEATELKGNVYLFSLSVVVYYYTYFIIVELHALCVS